MLIGLVIITQVMYLHIKLIMLMLISLVEGMSLVFHSFEF